jgi:hypothetical protein
MTIATLSCIKNMNMITIQQHVLDTNAGKQLSLAAADVQLTPVLKK